MKVIKNFLEQDFFEELKSIISYEDFPWRYRKSMTSFPADKNKEFFTYSFFNENKVNSNYYHSHMVPILEKLNCKSVIEIKANLNLLSDKNIKSSFHTDQHSPSTTAILYINTNNGGTDIKIKNKVKFIKSEENKIVIFPAQTLHRACVQSDTRQRFVINFNYFENGTN